MSTAPNPSTPDNQRLRIRFRKEGDLRWISHRDLVRAVERLCRRAGLELRMSEGFHPKPKMSFPSALGLGIEGRGELMELELITPVEPQHLLQQLNGLAPEGLVITAVETREPGQPKARINALHYQFPVPGERREQVQTAIEKLQATDSLLIQRDGRPKPIDMMANLMSVQLRDGSVCFSLSVSGQASARPRDVLEALGLADLQLEGRFLTRSEVEVIS